MSVFVSTTRISRKWLERKPKHELASIIMANIDKIDLFADENTDGSSALTAAIAEARDEGRRAGLEEAAAAINAKLKAAKNAAADELKILTLMGAANTLERLAAQAGEGANAD